MKTHPLQARTLKFIQAHRLIEKDDHILAAVSGGPDSAALLHILVSLQKKLNAARITVVHVDHQLRGEDSRADALFVKALAKRFELPFCTQSVDVAAYHKEHRVSLEMAARSCRHQVFSDTMQRLEAQKLALGHTADDQAEEVMLRLIRGTGPSGMAGMLPRTAHGIIRPLLSATREEVLAYMHNMALPFREDLSNRYPFCQRNALRLEVFPLIATHFHSHLPETIRRHTALVQKEEEFWSLQVQAHWGQVCIDATPSRIVLNLANLLSLHVALQRRILRYAIERLHGSLQRIYAVHIEALERWIGRAGSGKTMELPGGILAAREGEAFTLTSGPCIGSDPFRLEIPGPGLYEFRDLQLTVCLEATGAELNKPLPGSTDLACMDADCLQWPLLIRSWEPGDRFRPLGLKGSKKVQDFFTDSKIPRSAKTSIPLLCDREKICWILGYRLDDRVKVTPRTKRVMVVRAQKGTAVASKEAVP